MDENVISLLTDEHSVKKNIHNDIKSLFLSLGYNVSDSRSDTHAIGGAFWFPTEIIIFIALHAFDDIIWNLLKKGFNEFIEVIKKTKSEKLRRNFYVSTVINENLKIYFQLDPADYENQIFITNENEIIEAVRIMPKTLLKLQSILSMEILDLLGNPESLILKYDFIQKEWLIYQYNSNASIFYDSMPYQLK